MRLSTSNSDQLEVVNPAEQRKIYFKILGVSLLGMGAAMGIFRIFLMVLGVSGAEFLERVLEARAAIPQIVESEEDLVMVFGSSMVEAGFSPREFDQWMDERGVEVKSWNFGFGGLNPMYQDILSRRIREDFDSHNRRLKLAVIEFNPFQTTTTRYQGNLMLRDSYMGLLGSRDEMLAELKKDPATGLRLLNIYYLRDGVSAEMVTYHFSDPFRSPPRRSKLQDDPAVLERRGEIVKILNEGFEKDYPDHVSTRWSFDWQGGGTILSERSPELKPVFDEYYANILTPVRMENDLLNRIETADILDLQFEETLVQHFIQIVKNFQAFSDHVEVVLLPKNTDFIKNPPEAMARQRAVVARIAAATGVTVRDFQVTDEITPSMFTDTTHLNRYQGAVAFTRMLVDTYDDLLAGEVLMENTAAGDPQ